MERRSGIDWETAVVERHCLCPNLVNWYLTITVDMGFWLWAWLGLIATVLPQSALLAAGQCVYGCESMRSLAHEQGSEFTDLQCSHVAIGRLGHVTFSYRKTVLRDCLAPLAVQI